MDAIKSESTTTIDGHPTTGDNGDDNDVRLLLFALTVYLSVIVISTSFDCVRARVCCCNGGHDDDDKVRASTEAPNEVNARAIPCVRRSRVASTTFCLAAGATLQRQWRRQRRPLG